MLLERKAWLSRAWSRLVSVVNGWVQSVSARHTICLPMGTGHSERRELWVPQGTVHGY